LEGKRLERYEDAEEAEGMGNKSEFLRSVLDDGLDAREQTTYQAAGLSDRLAAQLEDEREFYDEEADILREVVEDGLTARRGDALDAIGADDELRAAVEDAREDGEPLDDTVRRLLRDSAEDGDSAAGRQPSTVVPATLAATLAVSVTLLATGEGAVGVPLAIASAVGVATWGLSRLAGWGAWVGEAVGEVRDAYREIGGFRGFFSYAWERWEADHPIEEPTTAVERVARLDLYFPVFVLVFFALGGVAWGVVEAGLLPILGPPGALAIVVILLLAAYAAPASIFVASLALLAVSSSNTETTDTAEVRK
jgi:hypothetical protein